MYAGEHTAGTEFMIGPLFLTVGVSLDDTLPGGPTWIIIVLLVGAVISLIATRGYDSVSKAANWMAPFIVLAFIACGIVALGQLEVKSLADFWNI